MFCCASLNLDWDDFNCRSIRAIAMGITYNTTIKNGVKQILVNPSSIGKILLTWQTDIKQCLFSYDAQIIKFSRMCFFSTNSGFFWMVSCLRIWTNWLSTSKQKKYLIDVVVVIWCFHRWYRAICIYSPQVSPYYH